MTATWPNVPFYIMSQVNFSDLVVAVNSDNQAVLEPLTGTADQLWVATADERGGARLTNLLSKMALYARPADPTWVGAGPLSLDGRAQARTRVWPGPSGPGGCAASIAGMASLPDSARAVLESAALAHLVTLNPDGSPQVTVVWVGLDGDEIVAAHLPEHRKIRNIRNDARVALSLETQQLNPIGLTEYLVIYGTARVTEGGAPEVLQRLAHTYLGPDVKFPPMDNPPPGYVTHIAVDRIAGVGPWAS